MKDMTMVIGDFTKMIHANPAHPENHNVQLKSLNCGYARVFNGTMFEERQALDVQDAILQKVGHLITNKCDEYQENSDLQENRYINNDSIENVRSTISDDILENVDFSGTRQTTNRILTPYR